MKRKSLPPYKLYIAGKETPWQDGKDSFVFRRKIKQAMEKRNVAAVSITVVERLKDDSTISYTGSYRVEGSLRPALYHVGGDNFFRAPTKPNHKQIKMREFVGVKMNGKVQLTEKVYVDESTIYR